MQPIVNGLEAEFAGEVAVATYDANTAEGQALMRAYGLRGHPSYVIVDIDGNRLWSLSGQTSDTALRNQMQQLAGQP